MFLVGALSSWILLILSRLWLRKSFEAKQKQTRLSLDGRSIIGIFHPYANAGGGGERVLWALVKILQETYPKMTCAIYTGDPEVSFDVLSKTILMVHLKRRRWIESKTWPRLTLLGQSLGSMLLGIEALFCLPPDIFIDTMGYAFTYPIVRCLSQCPIICYIHYPIISTDMLEEVRASFPRHPFPFQFGNFLNSMISSLFCICKLVYYRTFAKMYGWAGSYTDLAITNSSWTLEHIQQLWNMPDKTVLIYPPCDTISLQTLPVGHREPLVISVAQFRPEKNHELQLRSLKHFLEKYPKWRDTIKLVMIGGCRNEEDTQRVERLRNLTEELNLSPYVDFKTNIPYEELKGYFAKALIGLHTMPNEHFGIGLVECMAASLIPLAHQSGGPKMDIVVAYHGKPTGFTANTEESYANALNEILSMSKEETQSLQQRARDSVIQKFSDKSFETQITTQFSTRFSSHM